MWNKRTDCSVKDHRTQPEQSPAAKHIQQTVKFPTFLRKKNAHCSITFNVQSHLLCIRQTDTLGKPAPERLNQSGFEWSKRRWGDSGISLTMCKSFAPRSRQITTPAPNHSIFTVQVLLLTLIQQCQCTEGRQNTEGISISLMLNRNIIHFVRYHSKLMCNKSMQL